MRYLLPLLMICAMPAVASADPILFDWDLTSPTGSNFAHEMVFETTYQFKGNTVTATLTANGFSRTVGTGDVIDANLFVGDNGLGVEIGSSAPTGGDTFIDYDAGTSAGTNDDRQEFITFGITFSDPENGYSGWEPDVSPDVLGVTSTGFSGAGGIAFTNDGAVVVGDGESDLSSLGKPTFFIVQGQVFQPTPVTQGSSTITLTSLDGSAVPEPVSTSLFGALGLAGFFGYRRRKNSKAEEAKEELAA